MSSYFQPQDDHQIDESQVLKVLQDTSSVHQKILLRRWLLVSRLGVNKLDVGRLGLGQLDTQTPLPSPCVSVCQLNAESQCLGCFRTGVEISYWSQSNPTQQLQIWQNVVHRLIKSNEI
jgi:hypothetical protein